MEDHMNLRSRALGSVVALTACCFAGAADPASSQEAQPVGLEIGGVPAVNFDADEGVGYGAIVELYHYGSRGRMPYEWTLQPTVFLTSKGRRDFVAFFDAPDVLPNGWRVSAFLGSEKQVATPYYGLGNDTGYDEARDEENGPDPYYYRFGRNRSSGTFTLQRSLRGTRLRVLFGGGVEKTTVTSVPEQSGTTLYAEQQGTGQRGFWSNFVRAGLVWDTRDRETGTRSGSWTEFLVQVVDESLGADAGFARWTFTDRRYFALTDRLVFAHRFLLQGNTADAPAHELFRVQTSFKQQEGLGGSKTVRGVLKNRLVGRGMLVWNAELRWRAADFRFIGRPFHIVLSGFVDQGRVWEDSVRFGEMLTDLQRGFGGGLRVGMGENFVVSFDAGTSAESGMPIYIGLGYLY
jgi:hypothetical protein